ncbi:MAG: hypothetical protein EBW98_06320 [Actinobacteria bacterium]|nr:hypothetical protein [Actinomycetota bacterium]
MAHRTVPATMRAVVLTEFGGPEVLRLTEVPVPVPAADELLVPSALPRRPPRPRAALRGSSLATT